MQPVRIGDWEHLNSYPLTAFAIPFGTSLVLERPITLEQPVYFPGNERQGVWSSPLLETVFGRTKADRESAPARMVARACGVTSSWLSSLPENYAAPTRSYPYDGSATWFYCRESESSWWTAVPSQPNRKNRPGTLFGNSYQGEKRAHH